MAPALCGCGHGAGTYTRNDLCLEEFPSQPRRTLSPVYLRGGDLDAAIRTERLPEVPSSYKTKAPTEITK